VSPALDNVKYGLSQHAHIAIGDRYCVLLDLHNDKYLALDKSELAAVGRWLLGWNAGAPPTVEQTYRGEGHESLLYELLGRGLLTSGPSAKCVAASFITGSVRAIDRAGRTRVVPLRRSITFLTAAVRAHLQLRWLTIERTVQRIRQLKDRQAIGIGMARSGIGLEDSLAEFDALRPMFPRNYLCTFDSLALFHYLAAHGILADWVFGVRTDPFFAHCWLQKEDTVLNDTVERVSTFDPIMCV